MQSKYLKSAFCARRSPRFTSILQGRRSGAKNKEDAYGLPGLKQKKAFAFGQEQNESYEVIEFLFLGEKSFSRRPFPGEEEPQF
jgi:hypothetical protein